MRKKLIGICLAGLLGTIVAAAAPAADRNAGGYWRGNMQFHSLPFPRSERAVAIWNERACWSECGAHTAWSFAACLDYDVQGRCLRLADRADRFCQRECRSVGGPLVSGFLAD